MKLASLWVGSSWAVQPPTPLPQAAEKSPGWEKENRGYILEPPPLLPLGVLIYWSHRGSGKLRGQRVPPRP